MRPAYGVRCRPGVATGAVKQAQPERHWIDAGLVGDLVHKALKQPNWSSPRPPIVNSRAGMPAVPGHFEVPERGVRQRCTSGRLPRWRRDRTERP